MKGMVCICTAALTWCLGAAARAQAPEKPPPKVVVEFTTLNLMRDKHLISESEYESALHDIAESVGTLGGESLTLALSKWSSTLYGFVEADTIWDSTQSFNDIAGNAAVARPSTYAGSHNRFTMGVRNSRLGIKMRSPEWHHIKVSGVLEMDFLGNQPQVGYVQAFQISEGAFFTNPAFRIRHGYVKIETPWIDVLAGQYWHLFGWQPIYHPNTVEIQGVPGQIYSRTPQVRVGHTFKTPPVNIDFQVAMMRPPQRDSSYPEGQAGLRLAINKWTAVDTAGAASTQIQPLSFAVSTDVRAFNLPEFKAKPVNDVGKTGWGIAADTFIPILPGTKEHKGNSLAVNFEYAYSQGGADLYTGLNGGVGNAALPNPMNMMPAPTYNGTTGPVADPTFVVFSADGNAHLIEWQSALAGVQYTFPGLNGRLWISGNYSRIWSNNAGQHPASATTIPREHEDWADANVFGDLTPSARIGVEYAWFNDHYVNGDEATNHRVQISFFYIF